MLFDFHYFTDDWSTPDPAGLNFKGVVPGEDKTSGGIVNEQVVRWAKGDAIGGPIENLAIIAFNNAGKEIARAREADLALDFWFPPDGTRSVRFEGRRTNVQTIPSAWLLLQAIA